MYWRKGFWLHVHPDQYWIFKYTSLDTERVTETNNLMSQLPPHSIAMSNFLWWKRHWDVTWRWAVSVTCLKTPQTVLRFKACFFQSDSCCYPTSGGVFSVKDIFPFSFNICFACGKIVTLPCISSWKQCQYNQMKSTSLLAQHQTEEKRECFLWGYYIKTFR